MIGDGVFGGRVDSGYPNGVLGYLDAHELATPQRVGLLRAHGIPEAPFEDFEIHETGAGHFSFIDKATGVEYRRGPDPTLQAPGVSDVVAFTIDAANRLHYLRPRGPKAPAQSIQGELVGKRLK